MKHVPVRISGLKASITPHGPCMVGEARAAREAVRVVWGTLAARASLQTCMFRNQTPSDVYL